LVGNKLLFLLSQNNNAVNLIRVIFISLIFCTADLHAGDPQLIVNVANAEKSLTRNTLRAVFSMRVHRWPDGIPVRVFVLPDGNPAHKGFTREVLSLFPHQLRRSWDRYVYAGIGTAPIEVISEEDMIHKVATIPGGIGYISKEVSNENIRSLLVK
jgi:ABC-type phosphate transport system substrate-binding protein